VKSIFISTKKKCPVVKTNIMALESLLGHYRKTRKEWDMARKKIFLAIHLTGGVHLIEYILD